MADLGDTLRFRSDVKDASGVLVNAQTATLTVTLPDGTTATPSVINSGTGQYRADYVTTTLSLTGRYVGQWLFTFAGGNTTSYIETFDVGSGFVTVDEAVAHLRAAGVITTDADLEQLQWLCLVACEAVEGDLELAIARRAVVETFDGGGYELDLGTKPPRQKDGGLITVSSVVEAGSTITDYVLRKPGWRLLRGSSASPTRWARGYENITVSYVAGCTNPPRVVRHVAMNVIQTMWQASQQADHPFLDEVARRASLATLSTSVLPSLSGVEQSAYRALKLSPTNAA